MKSILIEGGMVVDPLKKRVEQRDLLIVDGKFENLEKKDSQAQIISARDKYIMPGLFDMRCHLSQPGVGFKKSVEAIGRKAAAWRIYILAGNAFTIIFGR